MSIPSPSRDALLVQLGDRDSTREVRDAFEAVGTTGRVSLTDPQKLALRNAITFWANQTGGRYEGLPEGIHRLRNALQDDLLHVSVEPSSD